MRYGGPSGGPVRAERGIRPKEEEALLEDVRQPRPQWANVERRFTKMVKLEPGAFESEMNLG